MNIQTVTFNNTSFVSVIGPGELELKYLRNNFGFDPLNLEDYINKTQVPKIEVYKNYSLVVLDFPFLNVPRPNGNNANKKDQEKPASITLESLLNIRQATFSSVPFPQFYSHEKKRKILASQVYFFIGKDHVVILHEGVLPPINDIFSACQKTLKNRNEYMGQGPVFLAYRIIDALVDTCFSVMNELASTIDKIDRGLESRKSQDTIEDISVTRRNIVVFQTMIKPIIPLFRQLEEGKYKELNGSMQPFWSNVLDHIQKIWDRLEDTRELIEGISTSTESLLTLKTNEIIKVLTIFSAIILPLNLLASIYGMNIEGLPFANEPFSFVILNTSMLTIGAVMLLLFRIKRWF